MSFLAGVRIGVASGLEVDEAEVGQGRDEGLGLECGLQFAERGVTAALAEIIEARCGVEAAVGVEVEPDSSWRKREGVAAAAGVALAEAPKKLLKRSLGEFS